MPTIADLVPGMPFKGIIYGRVGIGKTLGAATFPRPLILDFDNGTNVLAGLEFKTAFPAVDLSAIQYERFPEGKRNQFGFVLEHKAFDAATLKLQEYLRPDKIDTFDTIIVDTATTLQEASLNKATYLLGQGSKPLSGTYSEASKSGLIAPKIQDMGAERSMMEQFIRLILATPKNVLVLAHEMEESDATGGNKWYRPMLRGQSKEIVPLYFDEMYRVRTELFGTDLVRTLTTRTGTVVDGAQIQCKSRLGIPNGTRWSWPAIRAELDKVAKLRSQTTTTK